MASGTTFLEISGKRVAQIPIPVAPLAEQRRIVERLEELLSDLDAGVAALTRARAKLRQYRAAVLRAAVSGDLTAEWRAAHPDCEPAPALLSRILAERRAKWEQAQEAKFAAAGKTPPKGWQAKYAEPTGADAGALPPLPAGWKWVGMDALVCGGLQNGAYYPQQMYGEGTPIIRIDDYQNLSSRSSAELQRVKCPDDDVTRYEVCVGNLLINRVNSPSHLGKCLLIESRNTPAIFESNMMRVQLTDTVIAGYVRDYLRSAVGKCRLVANAKWAVNQASINQQDVLATPVPLPPLEEQEAIVAEVEQRLSVIAAAEVTIAASLTRASRLRQSILKEAFAGRLVPQDPADEPASALLERARAGRAGAATAVTRGRRKREQPPGPTLDF